MAIRKKLDLYIVGVDPKTGREMRARIDSKTSFTILHPDHGGEFARVDITEDGRGKMTTLDATIRSPEDAAKCLWECSLGCNGDVACVAGCGLMCSTIIV
ncbi:MAG: hypothetical protein DI533_05225 [Cereibacter sphaeroides]|uniref:Uncharacterized protein n=1 Tax=Cereibacter sphaeroides TaxID=1063 RepID=A0A2W5SGT0_CERSP|nr:MAG: hypothetical protein DI533_05225 [Cereibacter sphaeroides]